MGTIQDWLRGLFGEDDSRSEDLEREAAEELRFGSGGGTPAGPTAFGPQGADDQRQPPGPGVPSAEPGVPSAEPGTPSAPGERPAAAAPQVGWATAPTSSETSLTPPDEREALNEFARQQFAARHGSEPEQVGLQVDPESAAAKRDEALQRYLERKERLERERREARQRRAADDVAATDVPADTSDVLADVDGIGPAKRDALLERFGTPEAIAAADPEELTEVPGIGDALAAKVRDALG